jgi:hypothetical protein
MNQTVSVLISNFLNTLLKIRISLFFYTFSPKGYTAGTNPMLFLQALGGMAFIVFIKFNASHWK